MVGKPLVINTNPENVGGSMLQMDFGDDWPELREGVGKLCSRFPQTYWRERGASHEYPTEFVDAMSEAGYLAALIPEEYGGSGLPFRAATVILETAHAHGCNAIACHAQMYTMATLMLHGSEEQKRAYLPKIASGEIRLQAFGVTEPTSGSDTLKLKTFARRDGDRYIVNGQKIFISRAAHSDMLMLLARTTHVDEVQRRGEGLSVFLVDIGEAVEAGTLEIRPIPTMIHTPYELFFTDMVVPAANRIGEEGRGFKYILDSMNAERIICCGEMLGNARWFLQKATEYANERVVFERPIGQNQAIQFPIARAYAEVDAAQMVLRKACALLDAGLPCGYEANAAKLLMSEAAWRAGEVCMQTYGGYSQAVEYDVERIWRETRIYQIAPVSTNLILAYIGQNILRLPRSY